MKDIELVLLLCTSTRSSSIVGGRDLQHTFSNSN